MVLYMMFEKTKPVKLQRNLAAYLEMPRYFPCKLCPRDEIAKEFDYVLYG